MENSQTSGIKLLLSLKSNPDEEIDPEKLKYILEDLEEMENETKNENFVEEITDEDYNKNVREMDDLILDIIRTKQKLRLGKLKSKIKTKEDLLNFLNIRDKDDNKLPPEPKGGNSEVLLEKLKINKNSKRENEFNNIKEKLMKQEEMLKIKEVEEQRVKTFKYSNSNADFLVTNNKDNFFMTNQSTSNSTLTKSNHNNSSNLDDMSQLYEEIKKAESRCDDLLDDIDEYIKMGEDLL
jgi:hypothetical protein